MKRRYIMICILIVLCILPFLSVILIGIIPGSTYELFKKHIDQINYFEDCMSMSISLTEIQKYDGYVYYVDEYNFNLLRRKDGKEEILLNGVLSFYIKEDIIYYIYDEKDGLYSRKMGNEIEKLVVEGEVIEFAIGEDKNIVCMEVSDSYFIYTFDENWNQIDEFNATEINADIFTDRSLYIDGHIIFKTMEDDIYLYNIDKNKMTKLDTPISSTEYCVISDLLIKDGKLYYLTCAYKTSDLLTRDKREDCEKNGIYVLDIKSEEFKKISNECGFSLMWMNDKLYLAERWLIFVYLKEVKEL